MKLSFVCNSVKTLDLKKTLDLVKTVNLGNKNSIQIYVLCWPQAILKHERERYAHRSCMEFLQKKLSFWRQSLMLFLNDHDHEKNQKKQNTGDLEFFSESHFLSLDMFSVLVTKG